MAALTLDLEDTVKITDPRIPESEQVYFSIRAVLTETLTIVDAIIPPNILRLAKRTFTLRLRK